MNLISVLTWKNHFNFTDNIWDDDIDFCLPLVGTEKHTLIQVADVETMATDPVTVTLVTKANVTQGCAENGMRISYERAACGQVTIHKPLLWKRFPPIFYLINKNLQKLN